MDNETTADPFGEIEPVETIDEAPEAAAQPETQPDGPTPEENSSPAAAVAPEGEGLASAAKPESPQPGFVPLGALLDERDRKKALEAELAKIRQQQDQATPGETPPDPWTDPEGRLAWQERQFDARIKKMEYEQRLASSYRFATLQHGQELTDAAVQWAIERSNRDPWFDAQGANSPDPVGFVVQQYNQSKLLEQVDPGQLEQFKAWQAAQSALTAEQQQPQAPAAVASAAPAPVPEAAPVPKSIASLPSAGSAGVAKPDPAGDKVAAMFG